MRILALVASALVIGGCVAGNGASPVIDPKTGQPVVTPVDPSAAEFGAILQALAGKALGPLGYAAAGFLLPIIYRRLFPNGAAPAASKPAA